ncbi:MAG: hypothetical protein AAGJ81_15130 [Verrucomicrobiota bacterium]
MKKYSTLLASTLVLVFSAVGASAVVIADWDIQGNGPGTSYIGPVPLGSTATGVTASTITTVGVSNISSTGNKINSLGGNSWGTTPFDPNDAYVEFMITPDAGITLDLDTLYFNQAPNNLVGFSAVWELRSSLDGYSSVIATDSINIGFQNINAAAAYDAVVLGSNFDAITSSVTFRLYGTGFDGSSGQWFIANPTEGDFSNFTVEGSVIPEPAVTSLAAGILVLLGTWLHRCRNQA